MRTLLAAFFALCAWTSPVMAEPRVVLVTIDGLRWQEVFYGADPTLVTTAEDKARFVDAPDRVGALTPFLRTFATEGALIGNREAGSCARVENRYWFSYPGYAEMLAGRPNPRIGSNKKKLNRDVTVLEWLNGQPEFAGAVRVFAEWDVVPFIVNAPRSGLPVFVADPTQKEHDPPVMAAAQAIVTDAVRVSWINLGDTDSRAHEGDYSGYLAAAARADAFVADLWGKLQADPATAGQTTLIVTSDHGRGGAADDGWRGHGSGRYRGLWVPGVRKAGSDAVFMAVRGPGVTPGAGAQHNADACAVTGQVAATMLKSLGVAPGAFSTEARPPLAVFAD